MMAGVSRWDNRRGFAAMCSLMFVLLVGAVVSPLMRIAAPALHIPEQSFDVGKLPLVFEPNRGQSSAPAHFLTRTPWASVFFTTSGLTLALRDGTTSQVADPRSTTLGNGIANAQPETIDTMVEVRFLGANLDTSIAGGAALPGKVNYFTGSDPSAWRTDLPTYADITYKGIYPGIDLAYAGTAGQLKGTYTVAPGADPGMIAWSYTGASGVTVDGAGNLQIALAGAPGRTLTEQTPIAWQDIDGNRIGVQAAYHVAPDRSVSFRLGSYNPAYALVIDPTIIFSTFLGGSGLEDARGVTRDAQGNVYIMGATASINFPLQSPYQPVYGGGTFDTYIAKFDATGSTLIYSTYLGGNQEDFGIEVISDAAGNAYLTGYTSSTNFPVVTPIQATNRGLRDVYVSKLSPDGNSLLYSTYLGGTDVDFGFAVRLDEVGNIHVVAETASQNYPTFNPLQATLRGERDAAVTKLNPTGSAYLYSTYLGGNSLEGGYGLALDQAGNAYVTGVTWSTNFPLQNPFQPVFGGGTYDAFVSKISATGTTLIYSTYLGGANNDVGETVVLHNNDAIVSGYTSSPNFPLQSPLQPIHGGLTDAFLSRLDSEGDDLVYSTYLGGNQNDLSWGMAVNPAGEVYLVGHTGSTNFPLFNPVQGQYGGGTDDGFVSKVAASGQNLLYSTFIGGSNTDLTLAVVLDGETAYVSGRTSSTNFPLVDPYQSTYGGGQSDAVLLAINDQPLSTPTATNTRTSTVTRTSTSTVTSTATSTATATSTPTSTSTFTSTATPTATASSTATATPTACPIYYVDVLPNNPFYPSVRCLSCQGIVSGYPCGGPGEPCDPQNTPYFRPNNSLTRAQLAKIVSNSAGYEEDPGAQRFQDVPADHTFYPYVNRLTSRGHMSGYPCGQTPDEPCVQPANLPYFRPSADATRGQVSKIVSNAAGFGGDPAGQTFADVPPANPFYVWIERLASREIVGGYPCGGVNEPCDPQSRPYFRWGSNVTRGQASKIAANTFFPSCTTLPR
jgi:hypothetical protein